jgi:hypothetical protein
MKFDEVLRSWKEWFEQENVRYAVIGGLAVQAWGHSRFTKDVDIVVSEQLRDRVVSRAVELGYETLNVSVGYSNHLHPDRDFGRLDFMYVDPATAEKLLSSAVPRTIVGDVVAPVPRPEYLAMMKAISMKNAPARALFDGEDVRMLLKVPGVDRTLVRDYFMKHGLLELFDAIERAR